MLNRVSSYRYQVPRLQWLSTIIALFLVVIGQSVALYVDFARGEFPFLLTRVRVTHIMISSGAALWLYRRRATSNLKATVVAFCVAVLPVFISQALFFFENLRINVPTLIFVGFKLIFLGLSVLVPGPYILNVVLMLIFALEAYGLWLFSGQDYGMYLTYSGEPWTTVLYGFVGGILLTFRFHYQSVVKRLAFSEARADLLAELACIFLSIRDLANTPIQSLMIVGELLNERYPDAAPFTNRLTNATHRLSELNKIFRVYEERFNPHRNELLNLEQIIENLADLEKKIDL